MSMSMSHLSEPVLYNEFAGKGDTPEACFKRTCPGTRAAKVEICELLRRLEVAENEMMRATLILKHLTTMDTLGEKLRSLKPFPHQSEGHEIRQMLWNMERRVEILNTFFRKQSWKSIHLQRVRKSLYEQKKLQEEEEGKTTQEQNSPSGSIEMNKQTEEYQIIPPVTESLDTIVSFKLKISEEDPESVSNSPPYIDKKKSWHTRNIKCMSPTLRIMGGDTTMKALLKDIRGDIEKARERFCETRSTVFQLSNVLMYVKDNVPLDSLCHCSNEVANMKSALNALTGGQYESGGKVDFVHNKRLKKSEKQLSDFDSRLKDIGHLHSRIDRFQRHAKSLDANLAILFGRLDSGLPLRSGVNDNPTRINKLFNTIRILEENIKEVSGIPVQLQESEIQRDATVDALEEYVELLGVIKLDKYDLEDAFDEKVPIEELSRKVHKNELSMKREAFHQVIDHNNDLFNYRDSERNRISKCVEDILKSKISLDEIESFEKFLNKAFSRIMKEIEKTPKVQQRVKACATRKLLSDKGTLCCRCAKKLEKSVVPRVRGALTPYHAYELRVLEKKQMKLFGINNLNNLENDFEQWNKGDESDKPGYKRKKKMQLIRSCGGRHTVTTPEMRLLRVIPCEERPICHMHGVPLENELLSKFVCYEMNL